MRLESILLMTVLACACRVEPETPQSTPTPAPVSAVRTADTAELERYKLEIRAALPQVAGISVDELASRMQAGDVPVLIDVREPPEYAVSHLQGARRASSLEQALALLEGGSSEREIVVYCSIGYRSGYLAAELQQQGFTHVRNLEGSIFEWANTGHPVYQDDAQVPRVHPYDASWGRLLERGLWSEIE